MSNKHFAGIIFFYKLKFPLNFMRLTKRDIALTKIDVPSPVHSIYFRGKRYSYKQYLKIRTQSKQQS